RAPFQPTPSTACRWPGFGSRFRSAHGLLYGSLSSPTRPRPPRGVPRPTTSRGRTDQMKLVRWSPASFSPAHDLMTIHDEMNRLFDSFYRGTHLGRADGTLFVPAVDIEETPESFVLRADLPGADQKAVRVSLLGDTLTIRGERKSSSAHAEGGLHRGERSFGAFERSFTLGTSVRNDAVKAEYRDGVLEIT